MLSKVGSAHAYEDVRIHGPLKNSHDALSKCYDDLVKLQALALTSANTPAKEKYLGCNKISHTCATYVYMYSCPKPSTIVFSQG